MTVYYHQQGFLDVSGMPPAGAVAVSPEQHAALLEGQAAGRIIMPGQDGAPVLADPAPSPHHHWNGTAWTISPEAEAALLVETRAAEAERINAAVYAVQQPLLRFRAEYELRESQARAYAEGGYTGEVPGQVAAFATPANLPPQQAADIILQQAGKLHAALETLATLRMRKFELQSLDTTEAVTERANEILTAIAAVGEQLHGGSA